MVPSSRTAPTMHGKRPPLAAVVLMTLALNILGLTLPIACSLVFNRVVAHPGTATLPVLAVVAITFAVFEGVLRYSRVTIMARHGADIGGVLTMRLLRHLILSQCGSTGMSSARSVEYLTAVAQIKERDSGHIAVSIVELIFLPAMLVVAFFISPAGAGFVIACLALFAAVTVHDAMKMERLVARLSDDTEKRYDFLFDTLSAMHALKALGIEDNLLRQHDVLQGAISRGNHDISVLVGRLLVAGPIASQLMLAGMLTFGAAAVATGSLTLGGVSALVLLSGRVMAPLQRAVFLGVQMRDVGQAQAIVAKVFAQPAIASPQPDLSVVNEGRLVLEGVCHRAEGVKFEDVSFALAPGEVLALSSTSERATTALMRLVAGVANPDGGTIRLNGVAPTHYPQALLNTAVGYVPAHGQMFRGTIRDNITRFGEVTVDEAMSVAAILEVDALIDELPYGLDTAVIGSDAEMIPPGLRQQLSILRALATRPRLILLDHADRGLDRIGYAKLNRVVGKLLGQASFVIVSEDANLMSYASRRFVLHAEGSLTLVGGAAAPARTAYKELTL